MHAVPLIKFGVYNALPTGFRVARHGVLTWLLTALSLALSYVSLEKRVRQEKSMAAA